MNIGTINQRLHILTRKYHGFLLVKKIEIVISEPLLTDKIVFLNVGKIDCSYLACINSNSYK